MQRPWGRNVLVCLRDGQAVGVGEHCGNGGQGARSHQAALKSLVKSLFVSAGGAEL